MQGKKIRSITSDFKGTISVFGFNLLLFFISLINFFIIFPIIVIVFPPIYFFRFLLTKLKSRYRPEFGKILTARSANLCFDDFHITAPASIIVVVNVFEGTIPLSAVQTAFENGVISAKLKDGEMRYPELKQYPQDWIGFKFWKNDASFSIQNHIKMVESDKPSTEECRKKFEQDALIKPFAKNQSPWDILVVNNYLPEEELIPHTLLISRFHHSLADGHSLVKLGECFFAQNLDKKSNGLKKSDKLGIVNKSYQPDKSGIVSISYRSYISDQSEKSDNSDKKDSSDKLDNSDKSGYVNKSYQLDNSDSDKADNSDKSEPKSQQTFSVLKLRHYVKTMFSVIVFLMQIPLESAKTMLKVAEPSIFKVPVKKRTFPVQAVTGRISLKSLQIFKKELNVSLSSVLISACSDGLKEVMRSKGIDVPKTTPCIIPSPIPGHPDKLRNHMGHVIMDLPMELGSNAKERMALLNESYIKSMKSISATLNFIFNTALGGLCQPLAKRLMPPLIPSILISNFPINLNFKLDGHRSVDNYFNLGLCDLQAISFCVSCCNGSIRVAVVADRSLLSPENADQLVKYIGDELMSYVNQADV